LEIPADLKTMIITKESSLELAIADQQNLGICPLVLSQWLVARHNDLVLATANAVGFTPSKISSKMMGHHDLIAYDKHALMRFIKDRCATHGPGGRLQIDFKELERHLRHEFTKPELSFELELFKWLGETSSGTSQLAALIPQRDLSPEVDSRLRTEIHSPVEAATCLQKAQMAATFIVNSGASLASDNIGEMKLGEYLKRVLAESADCLPSATARTEVNLNNFDAFVRLLKSIIQHDPMEPLPSHYKDNLPQRLEDELRKAAQAMLEKLETLAVAMGDLVDMALKDNGPNPDQKLLDWLCPALEYSLDEGEIAKKVNDTFPHGLKMRHWAGTYGLIQNIIGSN